MSTTSTSASSCMEDRDSAIDDSADAHLGEEAEAEGMRAEAEARVDRRNAGGAAKSRVEVEDDHATTDASEDEAGSLDAFIANESEDDSVMMDPNSSSARLHLWRSPTNGHKTASAH